jgi:2-phospho-L-lactate guanylyltransferase
MKRLAIIVPVKPPHEGKSRLNAVLSASDRYDLNLQLLNHTFDRVADLSDLADIYVVSRSSDVLTEAARRGFAVCPEPGHGELNGAVTLGAKQAQAAGATEAMVLPIDLPWLSSDRLREVIDEFRNTCDVLIITDRTKDGTNLLLWRPIGTSKFQYGEGSASRHADFAAGLGLRVTVRQDRRLSFDLDTPHDFDVWSRGAAARSFHAGEPLKRVLG